jgi:hypothetical protein
MSITAESTAVSIIDRDDLSTLVEMLRYVLVRQELHRTLLTREGIEQLSSALSGRGLLQRTVVARGLADEDVTGAGQHGPFDALMR